MIESFHLYTRFQKNNVSLLAFFKCDEIFWIFNQTHDLNIFDMCQSIIHTQIALPLVCGHLLKVALGPFYICCQWSMMTSVPSTTRHFRLILKTFCLRPGDNSFSNKP